MTEILQFSDRQIKVFEAKEQDHWNLLDFLMTNYPNLGWTRKFMEWQYYKNPSGIAKSWIATDKDQVIANVTAIPHYLYVNGGIEKSWRVQDVITHPDYRGLGLYSKLSDASNLILQKEEFPLNFTFPNENSHSGFIKRNWINPNRIPLWTNNKIQNATIIDSKIDNEQLTVFSKADEKIWMNYRSRIKFAVNRNSDYLNWRYFQNPKGGYSSYKFIKGNKSGIGIFKIYTNPEGKKFSHLMDYFYEDGFDGMKEIFVFFNNFSISNKVKLASLWYSPSSEFGKTVSENGFTLNTDLTRWHVLNINSDKLSNVSVSNTTDWHISMGDSDVF